MPVNPTYPGIYIEELPPSERTIIAAPTSITVFIGYSHPFKTRPEHWGKAVRIQSFTEYAREFGGAFSHADLPNSLPVAVQQFFLNGGADAYVVGLQGSYHAAEGVFEAATATIDNLTFEALEPVGPGLELKVTISKPRQKTTPNDTVDITVTYGTRAETLRGLTGLATGAGGVNLPNVVDQVNELSTLVKITTANTAAPQTFNVSGSSGTLALNTVPTGTIFLANDFLDVFKENGSLDKVDIFNLMAIPGVSDPNVLPTALAFCERKRAFFIMDPPADKSSDGADEILSIVDVRDDLPNSPNGALYFPYLVGADPVTQEPAHIAPSGFVAGLFARIDNNRGVWKAPAGLEATLTNVRGVVPSGRMTDGRAGILNEKAINAIRTFPGVGTVAFGARTLVAANVAFQQWKYVPVRRTALFIEQTLQRNLGWVVFEPNDEPLWVTIRTSIDAFMMSLFRQGAFQGAKPSEAFLVKCDHSTTTQQDIDSGIVNILVGFRPLKPAEFVIVKIAQLAGQAQA